MAEYPALPLFTDAYLSDTRHLTTIQHGAYLLMLMTAWRSPDCALPNDDTYLSRIAGLDKRTWMANRSVLLAFWRLNVEQKWEQARLKDERNYVDLKRNKNAKAGASSALKRKNRGVTGVQPDTNVTSTPTPTPITSTEAKASSEGRRVRSPASSLPDWLPKPEWVAFVEMRKGKRNAPTQKAIDLLIKQLEDLRATGHQPKAVIEQSIVKGWLDFYPIKQPSPQGGPSHARTAQPTKDDRSRLAVARAAERLGFAD